MNCCYRGCQNDSRYLDPTVVKGSTFYPFPKPKTKLDKCIKWIKACGRVDLTTEKIKKHHYVCSEHFVGGLGPTETNPDPIMYQLQSIASEAGPTGKTVETLDTVQSSTINTEDEDHQNISTKFLQLPISVENPKPIHVTESMEVDEACSSLSSAINENGDCSTSPMEPIISNPLGHSYVNIFNINNANISYIKENIENLDDIYLKFSEFQMRPTKNPLMWCLIKNYDTQSLIVKKTKSCGDFGFISIEINNTFEVKVKVQGTLIGELHNIWYSKKFVNCIRNFEELLNLLNYLDSSSFCLGIPEIKVAELRNLKNTYRNQYNNSLHSEECQHLYLSKVKSNICAICNRLYRILVKRLKRQKTVLNLKNKISIRNMTDSHKVQRINENMKEIRKLKRKNRDLERNVARLLEKIKEKLPDKDEKIFCKIIEENPFITKENFRLIMIRSQMNMISSNKKKQKKWEPAVIKWCMHLRSKSLAAYEEMREVFILPSPRTLHSYSSVFTGKSGFTVETIKEMKKKIDIKNLEEHQKYFSILVDEMKIKEDLAYKASNGEIVGFCHLNDAGDRLKSAENKKLGKESLDPPLASHVMSIMVWGLTTNFKHILGYFPCHNMSAEELYSIIDQAIEILENNFFRVLTVICDKSSINQKFIKMSTNLDVEKGVAYKAKNIYAPTKEPRDIFYISDPLHLIKTVRNCFANSGEKKSRLLRKNGKFILWEHVQEMFNKDCQSQLRLCPKLTTNHITLGPFYAMKVKLATQIMSRTVALGIQDLVGERASETIKFINMFKRFFDMLNARNTGEGRRKRNADLEPYRLVTDSRFEWLEKEFLGYLRDWKNEANADIHASPEGKSMMQLSRETLEGIHITVHSIIGAVKFLLNKGAKFVLTEKFNQDPLERHFGKHRRAVGCHENPDLLSFGYSEKKFKILKPLIKGPCNGNTTKFRNKKGD